VCTNGSLGGVGISKARVYLDRRLAGLSGLVTGANKDGFHVRNVSVARDLSHATPADLRTVSAGEGCPRCGKPLAVGKALEVGHIFKLGTRYSESMGARVLDEAGVRERREEPRHRARVDSRAAGDLVRAELGAAV